MARVFLLSPADCRGRRATQLLSVRSTSPLSVELRSRGGAPLGDLFAFISALYFRGKLTYARRFAQPPDTGEQATGGGVHIITPTSGLRSPETRVTPAAMRAFARCDVDPANRDYAAPLLASARALARDVGEDCDVVLLGSIASAKYVDPLVDVFGDRLCFPQAFVGRGDMSRGGLLLRHAQAGAELDYVPVSGAVRHGPRPARLGPK